MEIFLVCMICGVEGILWCDKRLFGIDLIPEKSFNNLCMSWISYTGLADRPLYVTPIPKENEDVSC